MNIHKEMETRIAARSIEALRSYERISEEQHRAVLKVMMTNTEYEVDCILKFSVKRIGRYSRMPVQLKAWVDCSVTYPTALLEVSL